MKILITSPSLKTEFNVSGISSVVKFIIQNNPDLEYVHIELGKRDNEKRGLSWFLRLLIAFFKFTKYVIINRDIVVHFNYALEKQSILRDTPFILIAKLFRANLLIHLHGGEFLMKSKIPKWIELILKYLFRGNEFKVVLSEMEKFAIEEKYKGNNIVVLPNCVDSVKFSKRSNKSSNKLKLLFLGRLTNTKGLVSIVESMKICSDRGLKDRIDFYCAGKGPNSDFFLTSMREILGGSFHYLGVVNGTEKISVIKKCDIFLLPSISGEGLPMALLEAMSYGLVPVVTNDGSMKYVVHSGVNGFVIEKDNPLELFEKIQMLITEHDLLDKCSENAYVFIKDNFIPEKYAEKLNFIYLRTLNKNIG